MANIALGKLPIEKEWANPKNATNGVVKGYNLNDGFTVARWPVNFTIDLLSIISIDSVRFLLWDNLGDEESFISPRQISTTKRANRQYRYDLQLSLDSEKYDTYYSTGNLWGSDGWQVFTAEKPIKARYVRIRALHNNTHDDFHIVEFEIHDTQPPNYVAPERIGIRENISEPLPNQGIKDEYLNASQMFKRITELSEQAESNFQESQRKLSAVTEADGKLKAAIASATLINRTLKFDEEALECLKKSQGWYKGILIISFIMILTMLYFYKCEGSFSNIETNTIDSFRSHEIALSSESKTSVLAWADVDSKRDLIKSAIYLEFARYFLVRIFILSLLSVILAIAIKNYKALKHNYVVNKQKALSLAISLEMKDAMADENRDRILIAVTDQVYKPEETGYLDKPSQKLDDLLNLLSKIK